MERSVTFHPAYHQGNEESFHFGAVRIRFLLKGKSGAVQMLLGTDWYLPEDQRQMAEEYGAANFEVQPVCLDLGYHSRAPLYEGQVAYGPCEALDGAICYYDGSGLDPDELPEGAPQLDVTPMRDVLLAEGDEGVWRELESFYCLVFQGKD